VHAPIGTQAVHQQQPSAAFCFKVGWFVIPVSDNLYRLLVSVPYGNKHLVVITGQAEPHRRQVIKLP